MAHITTFNNQSGATFNDNSLTINSQQNNIGANTEHQILHENHKESAETHSSTICLNAKRGYKVNLFRTIIALHKLGFFINKDGQIATQKDVFNEFGKMLGRDFSKYSNDLSEAAKHNNDSEVPTTIFDDLSAAFAEYESVIRNK